MAELLFWLALVAYGEAAVAYAGEARHPGRAGRIATWGVRLGWLAQTGLLVALTTAGRFPWSTWAGSLNLVWLVVSAFLFWGCRSRYRLLGLVVMPIAVLLLALAYAAVDDVAVSDYSNLFLALHVGLVLAGLAADASRPRSRASTSGKSDGLKRHEARILGSAARARHTRRAGRPDDRDLAAGADPRHPRRVRQVRPRGRKRRRPDGGDAGRVGRVRHVPVLRWSAGWRDDAARTSPCSAWRSCSASSSASPSRTSHDACPRRHLVPSRPRRAPGEDGSGRTAGR